MLSSNGVTEFLLQVWSTRLRHPGSVSRAPDYSVFYWQQLHSSIRINLLNGGYFAIIGVGDNFCSVRIGDSLTDIAAAQSFQFGMDGQPVQIGFPVFQTVNALFLYGNHSAVRSLTAE